MTLMMNGTRFQELLSGGRCLTFGCRRGHGVLFVDGFIDHDHACADGCQNQAEKESQIGHGFCRVENSDCGEGIDDGGAGKHERGDINGGSFSSSGDRKNNTEGTDGTGGSCSGLPHMMGPILKLVWGFCCWVFIQYENEDSGNQNGHEKVGNANKQKRAEVTP